MVATKQIYFNNVQQEAMFTAAHTTVIVAGRRTGKTHGVAAPRLMKMVQLMPRSSGGIVFPSYKRGLTNTLPGTLKALADLGFVRDLHYVIGRKPPKHLGFDKPFTEPVSYEHVMTFYNGTVVYFISQDIAGSSNSLTLDWIICDEAKFLNFDKLKDETFPANGGTRANFGHCPYHHSMLIMSDMATTKKASWFLKYKDDMDVELIETIHGAIFELWKVQERIREHRAKNESVPAYLVGYIRKLTKDLAKMRSQAVYYREWSSIENLEILGENYIKQMKRDLPPLVFQTSILSKRIGTLKDGFYSALHASIHYYVNNNNDYLMGLNVDLKKLAKVGSLQDGDVQPFEPICIAMDYNANINWIVAGQREGRFINTLKSFFVKHERKIQEAVKDFCTYYKDHMKKEVIYYYDSTAIGTNYAVDGDDFANVVRKTFQAHGWRVVMKYMGQQMKHSEKHLLINRLLKGQVEGGLTPRLNEENNEALIIALEGAEVRQGSNGFQKNKAGEKLAESETDLLEHRTDGTDAFDTLVIGMNKFPHTSSGGMAMGAV